MEVRKLYYEDSSVRSFTAKVVACREDRDGFRIVLDKTAFFPGGGGQACDLGTLAGQRVRDVSEEDGEIRHLCDQPLPVGAEISGEIDWDRRLDLMQQHSGEHIVSGIIHRLFGYSNVGFHIGADTVTIDFDGMLSEDNFRKAEHLANQVVWENVPVSCSVPDEQTLPTLSYRSKRALSWPVRIVEIGSADCCACCGVHVKHTGQIGTIKLLSCVKFHSGVRIELVCGERAWRVFGKVFEQNRLVSRELSAKPMQTADAAHRITEQLAAEKGRRIALQKQLFSQIVESFRGKRDAVYFSEPLSVAEARELAEQIAGVSGGISAVFGGTDASGYNFCLASAERDVTSPGQALTRQFGGHGGGKAGFFQGSLPASAQDIRQFLSEYGYFVSFSNFNR